MSTVAVDVFLRKLKALEESSTRESISDLSSKAKEFMRRLGVKVSQGLGEGELCKPAICLQLAADVLSLGCDRSQFQRLSGCPAKMYAKYYLMIQKLLGVKSRVTARYLVEKFGCVRLEESVQRTLQTYKERYLATLSATERMHANFGRPVFIVVVFWLVAKKNKVQRIEKDELLRIAVADEAEFSRVSVSVKDLCFDLVGVSSSKKREQDVKTNRELLDKQGGSRGNGTNQLLDPTALNAEAAKAEEAKRWRAKVLAAGILKRTQEKSTGSGPPQAKKMKQGCLGFKTLPKAQ